MVEIIRRGQLPGDKVYQVTCSNCNTFFKFQAREANKAGTLGKPSLEIMCPLEKCGCLVYVNPNPSQPSYGGLSYMDR